MLKFRWWREVRAQRPAALLLLLLLLVLAPVSAVPSSESLQTAPLPGTVHFPSPHNLYPMA
jgi:hypothetical protein